MRSKCLLPLMESLPTAENFRCPRTLSAAPFLSAFAPAFLPRVSPHLPAPRLGASREIKDRRRWSIRPTRLGEKGAERRRKEPERCRVMVVWLAEGRGTGPDKKAATTTVRERMETAVNAQRQRETRWGAKQRAVAWIIVDIKGVPFASFAAVIRRIHLFRRLNVLAPHRDHGNGGKEKEWKERRKRGEGKEKMRRRGKESGARGEEGEWRGMG